jgi:hypothetical protein
MKPFSRAGTEPQLAELLADPVIQLVMRRDRITEHEVHAAVEIARRALPRCDAMSAAREPVRVRC